MTATWGRQRDWALRAGSDTATTRRERPATTDGVGPAPESSRELRVGGGANSQDRGRSRHPLHALTAQTRFMLLKNDQLHTFS